MTAGILADPGFFVFHIAYVCGIRRINARLPGGAAIRRELLQAMLAIAFRKFRTVHFTHHVDFTGSRGSTRP